AIPDNGKHYFVVYYVKATDEKKAARQVWADHKGDPEGTKRLYVDFKKEGVDDKEDKKDKKDDKKEKEKDEDKDKRADEKEGDDKKDKDEKETDNADNEEKKEKDEDKK